VRTAQCAVYVTRCDGAIGYEQNGSLVHPHALEQDCYALHWYALEHICCALG
jgi:hypothetical protein